jgi:hypothetical protein
LSLIIDALSSLASHSSFHFSILPFFALDGESEFSVEPSDDLTGERFFFFSQKKSEGRHWNSEKEREHFIVTSL